MATDPASYSKVVAADDAYIRDGSYANQNMNADKKSTGLLELKKAVVGYERQILLRFDLTKMKLENKTRVVILLDFVGSNMSMTNKEKNAVCAYGISNDWSSDSVTFNNAPKYDANKMVGRGVMSRVGICSIDVTDYVLDAYDAGETSVSFRLLAEETIVSQSQAASTSFSFPSRHPMLLADVMEPDATYRTDFLIDPNASKIMWDRANEIYDDWYGRYTEILQRGDYDSEMISSDPSAYTLKVDARSSTPTAKVETMDTRLMSTLPGFKGATTNETVYGGDLSAPRQEATGRFYVKEVDGRMWIIDPLGYPCYVRGINHLTYSYQMGSTYQKEAMARVYGTPEKWAIAATRWLKKEFNINVGAACDNSILGVEEGMAYVYRPGGIADYARGKGMIYRGTPMELLYNNTIPVFDPEFETFADEKGKAAAEALKGDPKMFGHVTDNEIVVSNTLLAQYLSLDYTVDVNQFSYATAWTWYCRFTGVENPRIEDIGKYSEELGVDLNDLFQGFVYDRYFKVLSTALKKYDPDCLYLGARQLTGSATSEWLMRFTGYWCDIYCVNYYGSWEIDEEVLYNLGKWLGIPMMVTEFYAKATDAIANTGKPYPNTDGAGWVVSTQKEKGYYYHNFALRLLECKFCIGWLYFQYIDNDPLANPQASNKGMVNCDLDTEVYREFNEQVAELNKNVYSLIDYFDAK